MRFLADEDFPRLAIYALRNSGWDVTSIAEDCAGVNDETIASICDGEKRILLTFDKDFGELLFTWEVTISLVVTFAGFSVETSTGTTGRPKKFASQSGCRTRSSSFVRYRR